MIPRMDRPSLNLLLHKSGLCGVEIGVQTGINAKWMLDHLDIEKLYLVDPYDVFPNNNAHQTLQGPMPEGKKAAKEALKSYKDKIEWVYKYSWDALDDFGDKSLDFVYVDGDHRKEALLRDLQYYKKLKYGGMLCGHDWRFNSVRQAIPEFLNGMVVSYECCNSKQEISPLSGYANDCDWWIMIPEQHKVYNQKCKMCQKVYSIEAGEVEWLK